MIKGIIIGTEYGDAENLKIMIENTDRTLDVKMDIFEDTDNEYDLIDAEKYEFILTAKKTLTEKEMNNMILPYVKNAIDRSKDYITIRFPKRTLLIDRNDVIGIEVIGKMCHIHTKKGTYLAGRVTLGKLIEVMEDPNVVRCSRPYAINIKYIRGFERETRTRWKPLFVIDTEFDCRVTDVYIEDVIERFEKIHGTKMSKTIEI